jgi:hypothetical protein
MRPPTVSEIANELHKTTGRPLAECQVTAYAAAQRQRGQMPSGSVAPRTSHSLTPVEGSSAHVQKLAAEIRSKELQQIRERTLGQTPTPAPAQPVSIDVHSVARAYAQQHGCSLAEAQRVVYAARQRLAQ